MKMLPPSSRPTQSLGKPRKAGKSISSFERNPPGSAYKSPPANPAKSSWDSMQWTKKRIGRWKSANKSQAGYQRKETRPLATLAIRNPTNAPASVTNNFVTGAPLYAAIVKTIPKPAVIKSKHPPKKQILLQKSTRGQNRHASKLTKRLPTKNVQGKLT